MSNETTRTEGRTPQKTTDSSTESPDSPELVTDGGRDRPDPTTVHDALAHEYRRLAIEFLDQNGHGHLDRITDFIESRTTDPAAKIRRALYHAHLPKLDEAGVATFDSKETWEAEATDALDVVADIAAYADSQLTRGVSFNLGRPCDWTDGEGEAPCRATPTAHVGEIYYACEEHFEQYRAFLDDDDDDEGEGVLIPDGGQDREALVEEHGEEAVVDRDEPFISGVESHIHQRQYDDPEPSWENMCTACGDDAYNHRCGSCGRPLCSMHAEVGAGFCPDFTTDDEDRPGCEIGEEFQLAEHMLDDEGEAVTDGGSVPVVLCRNDGRRMRQTENGYSCPECGHIAGVRVEVSS